MTNVDTQAAGAGLAYLAVYVAISVVGSWGHTGISRLVASSVVMLAMFLVRADAMNTPPSMQSVSFQMSYQLGAY